MQICPLPRNFIWKEPESSLSVKLGKIRGAVRKIEDDENCSLGCAGEFDLSINCVDCSTDSIIEIVSDVLKE